MQVIFIGLRQIRWVTFFASTLSMILFVCVPAVSGGNSARPLFNDMVAEGIISSDVQRRIKLQDQNPRIIRRRFVHLNVDALSTLDRGRTRWAQSVGLNLFDDANLVALRDRVKRRASGSYSWFGRIPDLELSQVILVISETGVTGNVRFDGNVIQIRPL